MALNAETVTVVSGLPRSGTSLLMNILEGAGQPILADGLRRADHDNPNGYYEYEPVKALPTNSDWVKDARGKVVKVIYRLLPHLPAPLAYDVLFMDRDLDEVIASQDAMIRRLSGQLPEQSAIGVDSLVRAQRQDLKRVLSWLSQQPNFRVLHVDFNRLLRNSEPELRRLGEFLDLPLDVVALQQRIEPKLYRNRGANNVVLAQ